MSREWNITHIPDQVNQQFKKEQVALFQQVNEDFTRMQMANNDVMRTVFVTKIVDYKQISNGAAEIRKRALRLRQNLVLPKVNEDADNQKYSDVSSDQQLKASLLSLDHSVMSFVTNPVFKAPNVVDPKLAESARRDLDTIIRCSESLKKTVDKLSKSTPNPSEKQ